MVKIFDVTEGGKAWNAGIRPGDSIVSVNGHQVDDVLDYSFYMTSRRVSLRIYREGNLFDARFFKEERDELGLQFETFLMDEKRSCRNRCIFCFIDQLPKGMRESLYFKDDDSRMSFISGSYVTLTNMSDYDIDRIVRLKTSPINISVHTTDPELRVTMLNNRFAGQLGEQMKKLADGGISMNCQIVLCRDVNDGAALDKTLRDLKALYPAVQSVSVVPCGLTKYREGLYHIDPFTPEQCREVIRQVESFADECDRTIGTKLAWCGDEFYIKGGVKLHNALYYEDYPQLENGVGLLTSMYDEFLEALHGTDIRQYAPGRARSVSVGTGEASFELISLMCGKLEELCPGLTVHVYAVHNDFFGDEITVSGLLTGRDIAAQLKGKPLGDRLLLPSCTLRYEKDMFLDDMTPAALARRLNTPVEFVENSGGAFLEAVLRV